MAFNADRPLILRPNEATADCSYDVSFAGATDLEGRYSGDRYIADSTYPGQQTQVVPGQETAAYRFTLNPTPSSFTPLSLDVDLTNAVPRVLRDTTFEVQLRHASSTPTACEALAEVHGEWRITADGVVERISPVSVTTVPGSPNTECEYEVVWPDLEGLVKPSPNPVVIPVAGRNTATGVYTLDLSSETTATRVHEILIDFPFRDLDGDGQNDYSPQFRVRVTRRGGTNDREAGDDCPQEVIVTASIASGVGQREIRNARLPGMHERCKLRFEFPMSVESGVPGIMFLLNQGGSRYGDGSTMPDGYDKFTDGTDLDALASYTAGGFVRPVSTSITLNAEVPQIARNQTYRLAFEPRASSIADVCRGAPGEDYEDWHIDGDGNIARVGAATTRLVGRAAIVDDREGPLCVPYKVVWPKIPGLARPTNATFSFDDHAETAVLRGTYEKAYDTYYNHDYDNRSGTGTKIAIRLKRTFSHTAQPSDIWETIAVTISPQQGSPPGCDAYYNNPATSRTFHVRLPRASFVQAFSPISTSDGDDRLVLRPAGEDTDCRYSASFARHEDGPSNFYVRQSTGNTVIRPGGRDSQGVVIATYELNPNQSSAASEVTTSIQVDTTANVSADTTFLIEVVPSATPAGCTSRQWLPLTIAMGTSSATVSPSLVWRPNRDADYCSYSVNWPGREADGPSHAADDTFSAGTALGGNDRNVRNRYALDASLPPRATTLAASLEVSTTAAVSEDASFAATITPPALPENCSPRQDWIVTVLASTQSATLPIPGLIHEPIGAGAECVYTVAWSAHETGGTTEWIEDDTFPAGLELSNAVATAANQYKPSVSAAPELPPPFTGEVRVLTVANVSGATTFAVRVRPGSDAPPGCSPEQPVNVIVANLNNSQVASVPNLEQRVAGADRDCTYDVVWPPNESGGTGYIKDEAYPDKSSVISAATKRATYRYKRNTQTPVQEPPPVAQDTNFNGLIVVQTTENVTEVTRFIVDVDPPAAPMNCSSGQDIEVTVAANSNSGMTSVPGLIRQPAGASAECIYTVSWRQNEDGGTDWVEDPAFTATRDLTLSNSNKTATNRYKPNPPAPPPAEPGPPPSMAALFAPSVSVTVPQGLVGLTVGESLFAGTSIGVTVARDVSMTHADCSLASELAVPFTVDAQGVASQTALPAELVGTLADGTTECDYSVTFPMVSSPSGAELSWTLMPDVASVTLSGSSTSASAVYAAGDVTFDPDATIVVPSGHAAKQFEVAFTSSGAGCDDATLTYTVQPDGSVTPDAANSSLVAYADGAGPICDYTFTFPPTETNGATLELQAGSDTTVTGLAQAINAEYRAASPSVGPGPSSLATSFVPSVSVTVPQLDGPPPQGRTSGESLFAGASIGVTVGRDALMTHGDCSLASELAVPFTVDANGVASQTALPSELVGTLADGTTECDYSVTFPMVSSPSGAELVWTLMPDVASATLSGSSTSASAVYAAGDVTFDPDATIVVPSGHAAKQFQVAFTSSGAGCDPATLTYTVQPDGSVTPDAANSSLVAYADGAGPICDYTFAFPPSELNGNTLTLQAGSNTTVTGLAQAITAEYRAAPVVETPGTPNAPAGGGSRGGSRGASSGGGGGSSRRTASGTGGSGGGATGPWVLTSNRLPVSVSLEVPAAGFPAAQAIEVMLNVPGTCGDDMNTFAGLAAEVGLVYAVMAQPGSTLDVLAGVALGLAGYAERDGQTRDCELRVTLVTAPAGCRFAEADTDSSGRSYLEASGGEDTSSFTLSLSITCE